MTFLKYQALLLLAFSCVTVTEANAELYENSFASVMLGKKKIGHVHFMTKHDANGILQELKTRSSLSMLGLELYHHTLHVHEFWEDGELQHLWGKSDDLGEKLIPAERFGFSGDWESTLWFDHQQRFLKWVYKVKGRDVVVVLDP